jgi:hypothetical protein
VLEGWRRSSVRPVLAAAGLVLVALGARPPESAANPFGEGWANSFRHPYDLQVGLAPLTYAVNNTGATLEAGEPTEGGLLTRSIWGRYSPARDYRVVIHTIGSAVDTVVGVYTGSAVDALTRITGNHTFPVAGLAPGRSLVQFDAVAGETYSIQIGTVGGAQGDIAVNVFQLPVGGGLSTFFAQVEGSLAVNGKDYVCTTTTCFVPTFVVHNSMDQPLDVVSTTSFGPLFDGPAAFPLGAGAATAVAYRANGNQDFLTTRTQTGEFAFSGRVGGNEVTRATYPGTVIARGASPQADIVAAVLPTARAGGLNQLLTAFATVINTGPQPAIGCVAAVPGFVPFNVSFQETDPATNTPVGAPRTPVNIAPGASKTFVVSVRSQGSELGDPEFGAPLVFQCANAFGAAQNLANTFAVTALGTLQVADMISIGATPTGDGILAVPSGIGGAFGVATVNIGVAATVTARPVYIRPFGEDDPAKQFTAFICETDASSGCVGPLAPSVQFTAAPNVAHTFAVFVQRPAVDPGFNPGQRRLFVKFEELSPPNFFGSNPIPIVVGSTSIAPSAQ